MEPSAPQLDITILGPLSVRFDSAGIELGSTKQRRLLAFLLMHANNAVAVSELIDAIWLENPPRTARKNLQVYVCGLRKIIADRISYGPHGYVFTSGPAELDLLRFDELATAGRRAIRSGDATAAAGLLGTAVRLWRGPVAAGLWAPGQEPASVARLRDRLVTVHEDWIDAKISIGLHVEALEDLDEIGDTATFRERLVVSRMRALSLCGRTLEALAFYEAARQYLAREYGIDPSPVLRGMYLSLLSSDPNGVPAMFDNAHPNTIQAATRQLPRDIPDIVERQQLRELLDSTSGIKVIWGRVGSGKSSLVVHAAHLLSAEYPDGSLFVRSRTPEGQPKDAATAIRELLRAVGLSAAIPADQEAAIGLWRSWTRNRKILLVLDDVPDEEYADALLPSSPESLVMITSRSRLSALEADQWIEVADFTEREAAQLLARLIGGPRVDGEPAAAAKIISYCAGSPLAIRMIGGKLAALPRLSLASFAARLSDSDPFRELVSGQASVEARYARWFDGLPAEGKAAARCLAGLSAGPFTHIEACQALAFEGIAPDRAFELLIEHGALSASAAFDEVTAHAVADVTLHAELYELPPLLRRLLGREPGHA